MNIDIKKLAAVAAATLAVHVFAAPGAERTAYVDGAGVMRWRDDNSEVAVFGVNHYAPFALDYRLIKERGFDHKKVIREDVAQLRRIGLDAMRLHCFDREFSTREGAFVDNHHVELLDYLIAECASNGIYTVLTPIAAWGGGKWTSNTNGFAYPVGIRDLTCERALWQVQARFLKEFASHVNRYTGRRYGDDPAVLCFELINEPNYRDGTADDQVVRYVNTLAAGIRASGTEKPVFYNTTLNNRSGCAGQMNIDGVTGVYYPTGLQSGYALLDSQLGRVKASTLANAENCRNKAKIIYEFDAADTPGAYMYPAMAKLFRSEGAQSATQFQYDTTVLAGDNVSYKTHYLNLIYTPEKALSLAVAAEVFRRTPRGGRFRADSREMVFPPFRIDAKRNLSEMVTDSVLIYSASTVTPPPSPERLRRVWGCGSSAVASSSGSGAYFLDRVQPGLWRLQLYPSVFPLADPYTGESGLKTAVLADTAVMTVKLPDLGSGYTVWSTAKGGRIARARNGAVRLSPGDYILTGRDGLSAARLFAARTADLPRYYAPPADRIDPSVRRWPLAFEEQVAEAKAKFPKPSDWNFFDARVARNAWCNGGRVEIVKDDRGRRACRYHADDFVKRAALNAFVPVDGRIFRAAYPGAGEVRTVVITGRAAIGAAEQIEIAFRLDDGQVWGTIVTLPKHWSEVRVPVKDFWYFKHWDVPAYKESFRLDISKLVNVGLCIGKWLDPDRAGTAHAFEISSISVE